MTSKSLQERPEKTAEVRAATAHRIRPPHTQGQVTPQSRWHSGHSRITPDSHPAHRRHPQYVGALQTSRSHARS